MQACSSVTNFCSISLKLSYGDYYGLTNYLYLLLMCRFTLFFGFSDDSLCKLKSADEGFLLKVIIFVVSLSIKQYLQPLQLRLKENNRSSVSNDSPRKNPWLRHWLRYLNCFFKSQLECRQQVGFEYLQKIASSVASSCPPKGIMHIMFVLIVV